MKTFSSYYYIDVYDSFDLDDCCLCVRYSPDGEVGELVYLRSGELLSGNAIGNFYVSIAKTLQVAKTYVFDQSALSDGKSELFSLRDVYPIASKIPGPWYAKFGFEPIDYIYSESDKNTLFNLPKRQSLASYKQAVEHVRHLPLKELYDICKNRSDLDKHLIRLYTFYLSKKKKIKRSSKTVHDLANALFNASKRDNEAKDELIFFFDQFLYYCNEKPLKDPREQRLSEALSVIHSTQILCRKG